MLRGRWRLLRQCVLGIISLPDSKATSDDPTPPKYHSRRSITSHQTLVTELAGEMQSGWRAEAS